MSQGAADPLRQVRVGDVERQIAVDRLRAAYADGYVDLSEFEDRTATALDARTHLELETVLADLPAVTVDPYAGIFTGTPDATLESRITGGALTLANVVMVLVVLAAVAIAVGAGTLLASGVDSISVFGSTTHVVDGDDADVRVLNVFGSTEVVVEDGVAVDSAITSIFGSDSCAAVCDGDADVTVGGLSLFGSVDIGP